MLAVHRRLAVLPEFVERRVGDALIRLHPAFLDPAFVTRLAEPDQFFRDPGCEIVKDQKKIKVGRLTVTIAGSPLSVYVKRYNAFSMRYKVVSTFVRSGARRALSGAAILSSKNIQTAKPVAAVERRVRGVLTGSFFISEEVAGGATVDVYWRETLRPIAGKGGFWRRRRFLGALAGLFHRLHEQSIYHDDLKDANILAVPNGVEAAESFFLLDFEGVRSRSPLSERRRIKNLMQLERTLGRHLRPVDRLVFLKSYLGVSFADRRFRRKQVNTILATARRVDRANVRAERADQAKGSPRV
jgi:hypothetical protein